MKNILDFFEKTVSVYPQKVAVKDKDTECTFEELQTYAMTIGSNLLQKIPTGSIVPVYMEKGVITLQIFLGIVYTGGCYSLLNPIQPKERTERVLEIIDAPVIITDEEHSATVRGMEYAGEIVLAEDLVKGDINRGLLSEIREEAIDTDPLYVNFTSGSTGIPKGVLIGQRSVIDFITYFTSIFGITSEDVIGNQAPFDFDVSVKDIYSMLFTGATLYIIPRGLFAYPKKLLDAIDEQQVTTLIWAVSALCGITSLNGFSYKRPQTVRKVFFSGEVMPVKHLMKWQQALPEARFVNLYGPTEITCNCTYYMIEGQVSEEEIIPIGRPFPNERVILINDTGQKITESNVRGELCVIGTALAVGYLKDKKRTEEAFVQNPVNDRYKEPLYRTGDIAYYRPDGNLVYAGRKDFQIKHMGHRIELGEIETNIGAVSDVDRACCIYNEGKKEIIAFYTGNAPKAAIVSELKKKMIQYMMPKKYINLSEMPVTKNGKIDRKKLKENYIEGK